MRPFQTEQIARPQPGVQRHQHQRHQMIGHARQATGTHPRLAGVECSHQSGVFIVAGQESRRLFAGGFKVGGGAFQRHPRKLVVGDDLVFNRLYYCPDISYLAPSKYLALLGSVDYLEASCNRRHPLAP
jgi:hypothetical protein